MVWVEGVDELENNEKDEVECPVDANFADEWILSNNLIPNPKHSIMWKLL